MKRKRPSRYPDIIAVKVPALVRQEIEAEADRRGDSMSDVARDVLGRWAKGRQQRKAAA